MSAVSSEKWIATDERTGKLVIQDIKPLLTPVWNKPTNLISIFGRARQGKSFLMNCLAGEQNIFRISNLKESCTQGIDISNKFMAVDEFSQVDGGKRITHPNAQLRIGFIDAEGQGDKDVSYDANLICPILLASKCVIFNWKGDMQKDSILSTLGIMTRAAKNVSNENSATNKKFGHLHIVFRDWQAIESDEKSTYDLLFQPENNADASTRNQIRQEVLQTFESIHVWLFEAPTESVKDLRTILTVDRTSTAFRQQVRTFRGALTTQLNTPMHFVGKQLITGHLLNGMIKTIATTLNNNEVILPSSTYFMMMKEEMHQLIGRYEEDVREQIHMLMYKFKIDGFASMKVPSATTTVAGTKKDEKIPNLSKFLLAQDCTFAHIVKSGQATYHLFYTAQQAQHVYQQLMTLLHTKYETALQEITHTLPTETTTPGTTTGKATGAAGLVQEYQQRVHKVDETIIQHFQLLYQQEYAAWLLANKQQIVSEISHTMQRIIQDFQSSSGNKSLVYTSEELTGLLKTSLQPILDAAGLSLITNATATNIVDSLKLDISKTIYAVNTAEYQDYLHTIERTYQPLIAQLAQLNISRLESQQVYAAQELQTIQQQMQTTLDHILLELLQENKFGFPRRVFEKEMNGQYSVASTLLRSKLENKCSLMLVMEPTLEKFKSFCATKVVDGMLKKYEQVRNQHLSKQMDQVEGTIENKISALGDVIQAKEDAEGEQIDIPACLQLIDTAAEEVWSYFVQQNIGWIIQEFPVEVLGSASKTPIAHGFHDHFGSYLTRQSLLTHSSFAITLYRTLLTSTDETKQEVERVLIHNRDDRRQIRLAAEAKAKAAAAEAKARAEAEAKRRRDEAEAAERARLQRIAAEQEAAAAAQAEAARKRAAAEAEALRQRQLQEQAAAEALARRRAAEAAAAEQERIRVEAEYRRQREIEEEEEAAAAQAVADMEVDEIDIDIDEDEYEEEGEEEVAPQPTRKGKVSSISAAEREAQRLRALEWREKTFGITKAGKKTAAAATTNTSTTATAADTATGATSRGRKSTTTAVVKKTLEQQRRDALDYAKKTFGGRVGEDDEDEGEDGEDEVEDEEEPVGKGKKGKNTIPSSTTTIKPTPTTATTTKSKGIPITATSSSSSRKHRREEVVDMEDDQTVTLEEEEEERRPAKRSRKASTVPITTATTTSTTTATSSSSTSRLIPIPKTTTNTLSSSSATAYNASGTVVKEPTKKTAKEILAEARAAAAQESLARANEAAQAATARRTLKNKK